MVARGTRTGVMIVRAWTEPSATPELRVRITETLDIDDCDSTTSAVASIDDVCSEVRRWLEAFVTRGSVRGPGS
jgi:hypothetical protein